MNVVDRGSPTENLRLYDELRGSVGGRTLEILERRRTSTAPKRRGWLVRRVLLAADLLGLVSALMLAEWVVSASNDRGVFSDDAEMAVLLGTLPIWVVMAKIYGLYDRDEERTNHSTIDDFAGVFHMVTVGTWLFWACTRLTGVAHPSAPKLFIFWMAAIGFITAGRSLGRALARRNVIYLQNAVIVGAGEVGQLIARKLLQHPEYGINVVGFVDSDPRGWRSDLDHLALLGDTDRLLAIVRLFDVERVIFAFSSESDEATRDLIRDLKDLEVQIDVIPRLFELFTPGVGMHAIEGLPLMGLPPVRLSRSSKLLKRSIDLAAAVLSLVLLSPLLVVVALAIKLDSPGPILFRQVRMGAGDRTFTILKFRTMNDGADALKASIAHLNKHQSSQGEPQMFKADGDPRVTRVGRFLRRSAIDELPQLVNVLVGDMSLVGPRPLILEEDRQVEAWGRQRLAIRPGITGLWQVLGRSDIPFSEMVSLDYLYVTTWSLWGDVSLMLRTIPIVLGLRSEP